MSQILISSSPICTLILDDKGNIIQIYQETDTNFFTHLELVRDENDHSFRTLNYVYPPVRARCNGHPLYNHRWSTTHPTTVPNRGPGEIYTIHDEDCCNDRGKHNFTKKGKKHYLGPIPV